MQAESEDAREVNIVTDKMRQVRMTTTTTPAEKKRDDMLYQDRKIRRHDKLEAGTEEVVLDGAIPAIFPTLEHSSSAALPARPRPSSSSMSSWASCSSLVSSSPFFRHGDRLPARPPLR